MQPNLARLTRYLAAPIPSDALAAFRMVFGAMGLFGALRFLAMGWAETLYIDVDFFFSYWGFSWLPAPSDAAIYPLFYALAALSFLILIGLFYRPAIAAYYCLFTYVELIDQSNYLNHYYFISLVSFLMLFLPAHAKYSLDRHLGRIPGADAIPRWTVFCLQLQLGLVYFFAGVAKLNGDWLFKAEPLKTWLFARSDLPLIGPLLAQPATAYAMSWGGMFFDLSIAFLLFNGRTRALAYALVVIFHGFTAKLFYIGLFPWIMMGATWIFFAPDWPKRLLNRLGLSSLEKMAPTPPSTPGQNFKPRLSPWVMGGLALYFSIQIALPLRQYLYPGPSTWTEEGYRFAWNVMRVEKTGHVHFRVQNAAGQSWRVIPRTYLSDIQVKMMSTQPDMILQFAHFLAQDFQAKGHGEVEVYADAWASLNGRPRAQLIDPNRNLAQEELSLWPQDWILPLPDEK